MNKLFVLLISCAVLSINASIEITNKINGRVFVTVHLPGNNVEEFILEALETGRKINVDKVKSISIKSEKKYEIGWEDVSGKGLNTTVIYGNATQNLTFSQDKKLCRFFYEKDSLYKGYVFYCKDDGKYFDSKANPIELVIVETPKHPNNMYIDINGKKDSLYRFMSNHMLILWKRKIPNKVKKTINILKKAS